MSSDTIEELIQLKLGSLLIKFKENGDKYLRHFYLDEQEDFISYYQSEKVFAQPHRYYIREINEVRKGFHTLTFDGLLRHQIIHADEEELAFSIIFNNYRNQLHLMADDQRIRNIWVCGLQDLIDHYARKHQRYIIRDNDWILSYLRFADKDHSNTMTKLECQRLLTDSLNVELPEEMFDKLFQDADRSGENVLTPDDFIEFFGVLARREDLLEIMKNHVKNRDGQMIYMNVDELLDFLRTVQDQKIVVNSPKQLKNDFSVQLIATHEQTQQLINEFEPDIHLRERGLLSLDGFRNLMMSDDFTLMKPWCARRPYQNMTRPLNDYYINTSHNTYLLDSQVIGNSNPEAYNRALHAGCRVVEIDCYDGDQGQPIVTHGHTLVKACSFESIIRFIQPNLFKTSPYPVIISIENHCSNAQRKEMATILQRVLGDQLITEPIVTKNSSVLPSPEDLKYKVLVRSVELPTSKTIPKLLQPEEINQSKIVRNPSNTMIEDDLFIFFENVPFREYNYMKDHYFCFHSSSLSEKQFEHASRSDSIGLLKQSRKCLLRVYPDAFRQDSSNFNPINAWNFGVQMVALNYEHDDQQMSLCYGKFLDNGSCGYVLKPQYLIDLEKSHFNPSDYLSKKSHCGEPLDYPQRLILTIISGQFFSRSNENTDDIPDPYVVISTHGILCDQQIHKTKFIENNGFNPRWNETFLFDIVYPQMCLVRFDVYDYDVFSRDDRLAYFCLPMTTMQTGYRHIHLRGKDHDSTISTLFVHVTIENL